jgi:hypothetical protein
MVKALMALELGPDATDVSNLNLTEPVFRMINSETAAIRHSSSGVKDILLGDPIPASKARNVLILTRCQYYILGN